MVKFTPVHFMKLPEKAVNSTVQKEIKKVGEANWLSIDDTEYRARTVRLALE